MTIRINGYEWKISFTHNVENLSRSDGTITLGVTDLNLLTIFLFDRLYGSLLQKVLIHELTHAWMFSYGYHLTLEQEEFVCEFVALHGAEILNRADDVLCKGVANCRKKF